MLLSRMLYLTAFTPAPTLQARPMEDGLAEAIDDGKVGPRDDPKIRSKILSEEFGWDKDLAKKIWCFGPDTTGEAGTWVLVGWRGVAWLVWGRTTAASRALVPNQPPSRASHLHCLVTPLPPALFTSTHAQACSSPRLSST